MEKRTRERIVALLRPAYVVAGFVVRVIGIVLFRWINVLLQKSRNSALEGDVEANLYFLYSSGQVIKQPWSVVHPFDYATVLILCRNIYFRFTRGQGQLNIILSPESDPADRHELHVVLAALDSTDVREQFPAKYLPDAAELLRPRMSALNDAFSREQYPKFREMLSRVDLESDVVRRQAQWDLNRSIYH
jgi:hypothetical protein